MTPARLPLLLFALVAAPGSAVAQEPGPTAGAESAPEPAPAWSTSLELYAFDPPDEDAYLSPIARIGLGGWRFEARWQYEDLDTGSLFAGHAFSWGDEIFLELVPLIGIVAGDTDGIAPALEAELVWGAFSLYSESEWVIDLDDRDDSFAASWNELALSPAEWISFGIVGSRTRAREQDLEVDRGLLLGLSAGALSFTVYWFNPDRDDPYLGLALIWER